MGNDYKEEDEDLFVTLTLEDDSEVDCEVIAIYEAGGKDYIALVPTDLSEEDECEVYLYRYLEQEDGEPGLENIEDDAEYEVASAAFDELLEDSEYDETVGE